MLLFTGLEQISSKCQCCRRNRYHTICCCSKLSKVCTYILHYTQCLVHFQLVYFCITYVLHDEFYCGRQLSVAIMDSSALYPHNHSSRALDPQCLSKNFKLQRMYLIWTCRDVKEFIWFLELMISTQKHVSDVCIKYLDILVSLTLVNCSRITL